METTDIYLKSEINRISLIVEDVLQYKLGKIGNGLSILRGRISTDPFKTDKTLIPNDLTTCGTFCYDIQKCCPALGFKTFISEYPDGNSHLYLSTEVFWEQEVIVDASIGQYLDGHMYTFVGTREKLREIFLYKTGEGKPYKIINTKSKNNPQEAFLRIFGNTGMVSK